MAPQLIYAIRAQSEQRKGFAGVERVAAAVQADGIWFCGRLNEHAMVLRDRQRASDLVALFSRPPAAGMPALEAPHRLVFPNDDDTAATTQHRVHQAMCGLFHPTMRPLSDSLGERPQLAKPVPADTAG